MTPVITMMVGRLDDWMQVLVKRDVRVKQTARQLERTARLRARQQPMPCGGNVTPFQPFNGEVWTDVDLTSSDQLRRRSAVKDLQDRSFPREGLRSPLRAPGARL
jgi:hypothetical protein